MPSLFSKIRHRKTGSSSSVGSNSSTNAPPSPSTPSRATFQSSNSPSHRSNAQAEPIGRSDPDIGSDVVVIDQSQSHSHTQPQGYDTTGHSAPFTDESDRPGLPTTTSNVNNPLPVPVSSSNSETAYVDPTSRTKALPAVPEVQTPGGGVGELQEFSLSHQGSQSDRQRRLSEVSGGPPVPPRSPVRSSISDQGAGTTSPPPLPHVTSTARDHLSPSDRPGIIGSASRPQRPSENIAGDFPHTSSLGTPAGPRDARSQQTDSSIATGPSSWSLRESAQTAEAYLSHSRKSSASTYSDESPYQQSGHAGRQHQPHTGIQHASTGTSRNAVPQSGYESNRIRPAPTAQSLSKDLRSDYYGDRDPSEHISDHLQRIALRSEPKAISSRIQQDYGNVSGPYGTHSDLEAHRHQMASTLLAGADERTSRHPKLNQVGYNAFHSAGMKELIGKGNTVDVHTQWLEPVVQEKIIRTEHTEYMTIIDREIHKYHIYPKIQPIYDPDPIRLETRHRIFSPVDGQWHEVIGDAAAIEILGEEAFRKGKKEVREKRALALPALDGSDDLSNQMKGLNVSGGNQRVGGQGGVYEREYKLGQKETPWKTVAYGALHSHNGQEGRVQGQGSISAQGSNRNVNRDSVGVAL